MWLVRRLEEPSSWKLEQLGLLGSLGLREAEKLHRSWRERGTEAVLLLGPWLRSRTVCLLPPTHS